MDVSLYYGPVFRIVLKELEELASDESSEASKLAGVASESSEASKLPGV